MWSQSKEKIALGAPWPAEHVAFVFLKKQVKVHSWTQSGGCLLLISGCMWGLFFRASGGPGFHVHQINQNWEGQVLSLWCVLMTPWRFWKVLFLLSTGTLSVKPGRTHLWTMYHHPYLEKGKASAIWLAVISTKGWGKGKRKKSAAAPVGHKLLGWSGNDGGSCSWTFWLLWLPSLQSMAGQGTCHRPA